MSRSSINPNLVAILGVLLIAIGAGAYVLLPPGSDRGVILVTLVPIATTMLAGGTIGNSLTNQTKQITAQTDQIIKQTNGHLTAKTDEIARAAVRAVHAENDAKSASEPRRTRTPKTTEKDSDNG